MAKLSLQFLKEVTVKAEVLADEIAEQLTRVEALALIRQIDERIADEDFTLRLARWADGEAKKILEARASEGNP